MPRIELFISKNCPSYEPALELLDGVREVFPGVEFEIVDCLEERERTRAAGVVMDPAFLFDREVISVGLPEKDILIGRIEKYINKQ